MKTRAYNFGAGPAMLPEAILLEAQKELLNWNGLGMSVMEIGHRTAPFQDLMRALEADLRELISIPEDFDVLFLGGAARTQFSMVPLNLLNPGEQGGYLISGIWSSLAYQEACKLKQAYCVASSESTHFTDIPQVSDYHFKKNTAYLFYTPNETINGVRFNHVPKTNGLPLIADMTSCLLSEPIDVTDYDLIFAGAQKNISIAGLTIVIVRRALLKQLQKPIPTMLDYQTHIVNHSSYATPPTFNCYLAKKMFGWIQSQGGVNALYQINCQKAAMLYQYLDASSFYCTSVEPQARSIVNVCFSLARPELEGEFLTRANQKGLCALQGHRTVGGLRASLYNAMPLSGVEALVKFMRDFSEEFH